MIGCLSVRCTLGVVVDALLQCLCPQADHVWFCENVLNRFVKTLFLLLTLTETWWDEESSGCGSLIRSGGRLQRRRRRARLTQQVSSGTRPVSGLELGGESCLLFLMLLSCFGLVLTETASWRSSFSSFTVLVWPAVGGGCCLITYVSFIWPFSPTVLLVKYSPVFSTFLKKWLFVLMFAPSCTAGGSM